MSIHPVMQRLADKLKRTDLPAFKAGDTVRVQIDGIGHIENRIIQEP